MSRDAKRWGGTPLYARPLRHGRAWKPSELRAAERYWPANRSDGPDFFRRIDGALVADWEHQGGGQTVLIEPAAVRVCRGSRRGVS